MKKFLSTVLGLLLMQPLTLVAQESGNVMVQSWQGLLALAIFLLAFVLVISEEVIELKKSKPMLVAAGVIWLLAALAFQVQGRTEELEVLFEHNLLEFAELFLFLLAAMTYINTLQERGVFSVLRGWLVSRGFTLRQIFWLTGLLSFCISPLADNLTTALLMSAVVLTLAPDNRHFIVVACVNIVVAANAGGAFSPFGDITTLMVWQHGALEFSEFLALIIPSLANWLVPAGILVLTLPAHRPQLVEGIADLKYGAGVVMALFVLTISLAVLSHQYLHLPPVLGMMSGLGLLKLYGYHLQQQSVGRVMGRSASGDTQQDEADTGITSYNIYRNLEKAEWDTLMFFYGIILSVGGLGAFGYLAIGSEWLYGGLGQTTANILVGFASALVDNIPVMFAVLEMDPVMSKGQWLLVTLSAGVGGSILSIGSAAGVAVMGQAKGRYTFLSHLRWSWAVVLGYVVSILLHIWLNADKFSL